MIRPLFSYSGTIASMALGATVLARDDTFVVLADPEGNELCLSRREG